MPASFEMYGEIGQSKFLRSWNFRTAHVDAHVFPGAAVGRDLPPPITHPEFYYGFIGVGVARQLVLIGSDPVRYRPINIAAIVEKFSYGVAVLMLAAQNRIAGEPLHFGILDLAWGVIFTVVYFSGGSAARR
jgi:hypothetical protein